jgi:hypothetical protein
MGYAHCQKARKNQNSPKTRHWNIRLALLGAQKALRFSDARRNDVMDQRSHGHTIVPLRRRQREYFRSCIAMQINSGMLGGIRKQRGVSLMSHNPIASEAPLAASPNQTMRAIQATRRGRTASDRTYQSR